MISWPEILIPRSNPHDLRNMAATGGRTGSGREQRVFNDAGYWEIGFNSVPIRTRAQALAWRAMVSKLRTGEAILVKIYDKWFADGANGVVQEARVGANAALRATTMMLTTINLELEPGVEFSIGQRLYRITEVTSHDPAEAIADWLTTGSPWDDVDGIWVDAPMNGSASWTVKILPPLRAAAAAGAEADFRDRVCLCVIDDVGGGGLDLDLARFADPSITLIEAF